MNVECLVAQEAMKLLARDPAKYIRGVSGLYLLSSKGLELGRVARASYFFVRHVDDLLDGHRNSVDDPLAYANGLKSQITTNTYTSEPGIANLAQYSLEVLERKAKPTDNPRQDFLDAIDAIIFDHQRSQNRQALSGSELEEYYKRAFFPVVNIMLIGLESQFRAPDIPALSYCQGRVSSVRDLSDDWRQGVINIPQEVLEEAELTSYSLFPEVKRNPVVRNWHRGELLKSRPELLVLQKELESSGEGITYLMGNGLIKPMLKLVDRYTSY